MNQDPESFAKEDQKAMSNKTTSSKNATHLSKVNSTNSTRPKESQLTMSKQDNVDTSPKS